MKAEVDVNTFHYFIVVVVVDDDIYYWVYLSSDHLFFHLNILKFVSCGPSSKSEKFGDENMTQVRVMSSFSKLYGINSKTFK